MRKLRKPPAREVETSRKEPLAEGLMVEVPTDSRGRRMWGRISDEEIVELASKVMEKRRITGRKDLERADRRLYEVLRKRELLDKVEFGKKLRTWRAMKDEEIIQYTRKLMEKKGITGRHDLDKADSGLYRILNGRGLLEEVGFEKKREKYRSWEEMSNEEIVEFARKLMMGKEISERKDLRKADSGLYEILRVRGLLDRAFAQIEEQRDSQARDAVIDALEAFAADPTS